MKRLHLLWLIPALLLGACDSDRYIFDEGAADEGAATFSLSTESFGVIVSSRAGEPGSEAGEADARISVSRAAEPKPLALQDLEYVLTDADGNVVRHHYGRLEDDFSLLRLEGLKYGSYSLAFIGSAEGSAPLELEPAANVSNPWMVHDSAAEPLEGVYFHKKVDFVIGADHAPVNQAVELELAVAKVEVGIELANESMWRYIKNVSVNIDGELPNTINVDGSFAGAHNVADYTFPRKTNDLSFTVFPSETPKDGYVEIQSVLEDGTPFTTRYPFRGLTLQKGRISHIDVAYRHPENLWGKIVVFEDDYWHFRPDTMFMSDEPREVMYDRARRSFNVNEPLQLRVNDEGMFTVNLYSPIPVERVRVYARFNNLSNQWVDFAYLDHIPPFIEAAFPVPATRGECQYKTTSGRTIRVPAMPDLKGSDVELRFETDDPFMAKIATIKLNMDLRFSKFNADNANPGNYRHMTPILCRHAVAQMLNMSYVLSTPEFDDALRAHDGILKDNNGNPIVIDNLRQNIYNYRDIVMGHVAGVGGLASILQLTLSSSVYSYAYPDFDTANAHSFSRMSIFHEYGHVLGYSHSSNMTYGDVWTVFCCQLYLQLGQEGRVPVPHSSLVTSLPYDR